MTTGPSAVRGSFFRGLKTSPADAVALPLALRALTAGKASFEVATNSARASSCQRSAWASHFPLFLGSVLARSKHRDSIMLQSLSLIARLPAHFPRAYPLSCDRVTTYKPQSFLGC